MRRLLPSCVLAVALAGCAEASSDALDGTAAEPWSATEALRIGTVDDPTYSLTRPSALTVAEDGTLYSVHPDESRVRIWSADGEAIGSFGGPGDGPGDFQRPAGFGFVDDSLWVFDSGLYRTTWFDRDGEVLGTVNPRVDMGQPGQVEYPPRPHRPLLDGTYIGRPLVPSHLVAQGEIDSGAWVRMSAEGRILDTLLVEPFDESGTLAILRDDGGGTFTRQPWSDAPLVLDDPWEEGLVLVERRAAADEARRGRVQVHRVTVTGDTLWTREMRFEAEPVPAEQVDSAVQAIAERLHEWIGERTGESVSDFRDGVRDGIYEPPHRPVVTEAMAGRDGTVWLALQDGPDTPPEGRRWLVLDPDGANLGRVVLPRDLTVLAADREHVWGVELDELDVPYIVRYAVAPEE